LEHFLKINISECTKNNKVVRLIHVAYAVVWACGCVRACCVRVACVRVACVRVACVLRACVLRGVCVVMKFVKGYLSSSTLAFLKTPSFSFTVAALYF
jgi:hypothetical protein